MRRLTAILITAVIGVPGLAFGQAESGSGLDHRAEPNYSVLNLIAGFDVDPRIVRVTAGGPINAATAVGSHCVGRISGAPDARLNYEAGPYPLIVSVASSDDTTLIIHGPDGVWHCDDNSGQNEGNPSITFDTPARGAYAIWVGASRPDQYSRARLHISEIRSQ